MTKYDKKMIETALSWAEMSSCKKKQVGSIISRNDRIISVGYNGSIPKDLSSSPELTSNECEDADGNTKEHILHAEYNAIMFLVREQVSLDNSTIYLTTKPCLKCAELILNTGITKVFYKKNNKSEDGLDYLKQTKIEVIGYD
jgi:dCMP deaminase